MNAMQHPRRFQSTPSRGGRHIVTGRTKEVNEISIHALTRRATQHGGTAAVQCGFQSTPSRGGRLYIYVSIFPREDFNPRPHEEGDQTLLPVKGSHLPISIHALTRRATTLYCRQSHTFGISIHALTRRATVEIQNVQAKHARFQSTPSRGGRRCCIIITQRQRLTFQSTPSRGGRL